MASETPEGPCCETCLFFTEPGKLRLLSKGGAEGICRRVPAGSVHPTSRATQPEMAKSDWCGEYKNK